MGGSALTVTRWSRGFGRDARVLRRTLTRRLGVALDEHLLRSWLRVVHVTANTLAIICRVLMCVAHRRLNARCHVNVLHEWHVAGYREGVPRRRERGYFEWLIWNPTLGGLSSAWSAIAITTGT
jgi:hypothetical protein